MTPRFEYHHVTGILSSCNVTRWDKYLSKKERHFYLNRGSMIHLATALYDHGKLDRDSVDSRIEGFLKAWIRFREEQGGKVTAIEQRVEDKKRGYRGTLDRIITGSKLYPIGHLLIDIKTNEASVYTKLQTMAYAMAQRRKVRRGAVSLFENGFYKFSYYDNDAEDGAAWNACLLLNRWVQKNK